MTLQVIPIKLMVQCPEKSEISDADLIESRECHKCQYQRWLFANEVHCNYPEPSTEGGAR